MYIYIYICIYIYIYIYIYTYIYIYIYCCNSNRRIVLTCCDSKEDKDMHGDRDWQARNRRYRRCNRRCNRRNLPQTVWRELRRVVSVPSLLTTCRDNSALGMVWVCAVPCFSSVRVVSVPSLVYPLAARPCMLHTRERERGVIIIVLNRIIWYCVVFSCVVLLVPYRPILAEKHTFFFS